MVYHSGGNMPTASEFIKFAAPMLEMAQTVVDAKGEELKLC